MSFIKSLYDIQTCEDCIHCKEVPNRITNEKLYECDVHKEEVNPGYNFCDDFKG